MSKITVKAKTVEEALIKASIQLGVTSDKLQYEVLEKGKSGILGIGSKSAVIEVVQSECEDLLEETVVEPNIENVETNIEKESVKVDSKQTLESQNFKSTVNTSQVKVKEVKEVKEKKLQNTTPKENKIKAERVNSEVTEHTIVVIKKFVEDILTTMDIQATVITSIEEDGSLVVNMEGKDMGVLIGKRGQTLDSLQYLLNRVANKEQDGYVRVKLDTENYRERRKKTLENLAKNIAYKVKKTRQPVSLEPMNPYERRIIHAALQNDLKVSTHSEGEEPYRKVVVTLAKH